MGRYKMLNKLRTLISVIKLLGNLLSEFGMKDLFSKTLELISSGGLKSRLRDWDATPPKELDNILNSSEILVVAHSLQSASNHYRGSNFLEAFRLLGFEANILHETEFQKIRSIPTNIRVIIFCRTATTLEDYLWYKLKPKNLILIYDTDDLIFDEEVYNLENVSELKNVSSRTFNYLTGEYMFKQQRIIAGVDIVTAPTDRILSSYRKYTEAPSIRILNVLKSIPKEKKPDKNQLTKQIIIGYTSGNKSHQEDFLVVIEALWEILREFPQVSLLILGISPITKNQVPIGIRSQVIFKGFIPHAELLENIKDFDINLAPLVINDFNDGKSELKFVHAASVSVPTVASPTEHVRSVIINASNGYIADNSKDFKNILTQLIEDDLLRSKIGSNAYQTFIAKFTISTFVESLRLNILPIINRGIGEET